MALIVEDGTGKSDAEAYASVAEAVAYLAKFGITDFEDTAATGTLTIAEQPSNGDTMVIGTKTYTFQTSLTDVDGNIEIGSSLTITQSNVKNAINLTGSPGTGYAASMTLNADASLGSWVSNVATVTATTGGSAGNSLATTSSFTDADNGFAATTMSGGIDDTEIDLRKGARWLDGEFTYKGYRKVKTQALDFPREGIVDPDGYDVDDSSVPTKIQQANIIAAYKSNQGTVLEVDVTDSSQVTKDLVKVGPITVEKGYDQGAALSNAAIYDDVENLVRDLITGINGGVVRG